MDSKYLILATSMMIVGCSGGGGSNTTQTGTPKTGVFLDSAVEGIGYSTPTFSGTTNADGEFKYKNGEMVTFALYGQKISQAQAFDVITPANNTDVSVGSDYLINVLRFLQTLDADSNPGNGITLPDVSGTMDIDFDQTADAFSADPVVASFISANANSTLISSVDAASHFATTLASVSNPYTLNLAGKNAISIMTTSYCDDDFKIGFNYSFTNNGYTFSGIDTTISNNFTNCTAGPSSVSNDTFKSFPDFGLDCGPVCSYNDLNTVRTDVDRDGRSFITTISHTPNTNIVTYVKRITEDPSNPGIKWSSRETIIIGGLTDQTLIGSWYIDSGNKTIITFIDENSYFVTQDAAELACSDGMETGTYSWNSITGSFTLTNVIDTTGDCGLTSTQGETYTPNSVSIAGNILTLSDNEGDFPLTRVVDSGNPLIGSWYIADGNKTVVTFIDDSQYFVTQEVEAGELTAIPPSSHGMEYGTYTYNTNTGNIVFTNVIDTTGDSGFTSTQGNTWGDVGDEVTIEVGDGQLIFTYVDEGGGSFTLDAVR